MDMDEKIQEISEKMLESIAGGTADGIDPSMVMTLVEYFKSMGKSISEIKEILHSMMPNEEFWPQVDYLVEMTYGQL